MNVVGRERERRGEGELQRQSEPVQMIIVAHMVQSVLAPPPPSHPPNTTPSLALGNFVFEQVARLVQC